jgi:hypothetical protein
MMAKAITGRLIVCVHSADAPSDAEWDVILGMFGAAADLRMVRVLVFTLGGAPNARQRSKLNSLVGSERPRIAVLTPSAIARAAGTAISWFIPTLKMFDTDELDSALGHLDATRLDRDALTRTLSELRRELGV